MQQLFIDWSCSDTIIEWKIIARYSRIYSTVNFITYVFAIFSFYPIIIHAYFTKPEEQRMMFFDAAYPFDYLSSPAYEATILVQILQGVPLALADSVTQSLFVTLVLKCLNWTFYEIFRIIFNLQFPSFLPDSAHMRSR